MNNFFKRFVGILLAAACAALPLSAVSYAAEAEEICGDVDGSGIITANDAGVLLSYIRNPDSAKESWHTAAKITNVSSGDESVLPTTADAALILKKVLNGSIAFNTGAQTPSITGEEKSIMTASGDKLISNSTAHVKDSYDGYVESFTSTDFDYFKVEYTVEGAPGADTTAFVFQPYDTSWGGWEENPVTIGDSAYDEATGIYTVYANVADIKATLSTGKALQGINISFAQAEPKITIKDIKSVTTEKEEDPNAFEPYVKTIITETELNAEGVAWQGAAKAAVYVKMTEGGDTSQLNAAISLAPNGAGKSSSKYLVGKNVTTGKTGNAIQDDLIGKAGTGNYVFPDVNLNKSMQDGSTWDDSYAEYITIKIRIDTENTDYEFLGIKFSNGAVYPKDFTVPVTEAKTYDDPNETEVDGKALLKLTLDYCQTMDSSKYQDASWETFQTALTSAQAVYDNEASTSDGCLSARASLEKTKANMLFKDTETEKNPKVFRELSGDETIAEMGAGINLGNTMDGHIYMTPGETAWQSVKTTKAYIKTLHDAGFNTVRIPVTWGTMIDDDNGYSINEAWIGRVKEIVDYCVSQDMYAIINIHHDGADLSGWLNLSVDDIDKVYEKYECVWRNIAEYFKDYDEHLIFESMNEVSCMEGDSKNSTEAIEYDTPIIVNLNQIFVNTVRSTGSNNASRWLEVVSHYANGGTQSGYSIPADSYNTDNRLMFALHIYKSSTNTTWTYDEVYQVVTGLKNAYNKHKMPMVLGEYGTRTQKQNGTETGYNDVARAYFSEIVGQACQTAHCVPIVWDQGYNDGDPLQTGLYTYYDRATNSPLFKTIIDGIMRGVYLPNTAGYSLSGIVEGPTLVPITELTLSADNVALKLYDNYTVTAATAPSNTNDVVLWSTDDDSIATVSQGKIRARGIGTTTIRAYTQNGACAQTVTVTVTE